MKRVTKLERVYDEIDREYSKATPEQMQEAIKKLQEELEKNKGIVAKMETAPADKREPFEKSIKDLEKRITNMEGYSKSRVQIHKVKDYKANLERKLSEETKKKALCEKALEKAVPELEEVLKQLKDEKYTMELDQDQYNDLLQKKEDLTKEIRENRESKDLATKRIAELQAKIGKCDLAWKTLFVNKDWDEIQRRAVSDEKRFTRKVDEKHPPIKSDKNGERKGQSKEDVLQEKVREKIANNVKDIMEAEREERKQEGDNLPAPVSKWDKFKNWFRNIPKNLKKTFGRTEIQTGEQIEEQESFKKDTRDQFLEGLRQYADEEYRKQVKEEKEKAYIESHKAKPKEERTTEER